MEQFRRIHNDGMWNIRFLIALLPLAGKSLRFPGTLSAFLKKFPIKALFSLDMLDIEQV